MIAAPSQAERESFFAAQARHRAAARRWSLAMGAAVLSLTLLVSLLLAPLCLALAGLLADLLNLLLPMPDPLGALGRLIDALDDSAVDGSASRILGFVLPWALPGFVLMLLAWRRLGRSASAHPVEALRASLGLREPCGEDPEEIQLRNVVAEMSLAAGRAPPQLWLSDHPACNVGVFGDGERAALVITRGVLDRLGRAQTQALVGQAVAALGNGDGLLAERLLRLSLMIGLLRLLAQSPIESSARAALRPLLRRRRGVSTAADVALVLGVLGDVSSAPQSCAKPDSKLGWRDWALMPLLGSLLVGVLIVPLGTMLLVAPLGSLLRRRRRLLADAMAVQFTRDPQALAQAYAALAQQSSELRLAAPALGELFCLETTTASNLRLFSPYPPLVARIARLNSMGANVEPPPAPARPSATTWLLLAPLLAVAAALMGVVIVLGTWLSLALNMLFLALPAGLAHLLLRSIGHA